MEISNPAQNLQPNPKKRSSDFNVHIQHSHYFKIRALLKDLRPQFLEVLRTPDFQASKAACEINQLKSLQLSVFHIYRWQNVQVLMKLYEEMTSETNTMEECKNTIADNVHDQKKSTEVKPADPPVEKKSFIRKPSEERPATVEKGSHGSYIVGGSAFGWNFITYPGRQLTVYYGTTKEDFRAANPIPTYLEKVE
ncbi:hypothetical protein L1987_12374 [Smallanthus sonchifolius]|uniref:Uncharacterized protein n=1 Tax=Smallanthus sonchifolius TaxID=185202 RepID=A0ACB9JE18_9ASTR|nr:hypothetical protein L1987_12374 [Smallanthus sonchifolius]